MFYFSEWPGDRVCDEGLVTGVSEARLAVPLWTPLMRRKGDQS